MFCATLLRETRSVDVFCDAMKTKVFGGAKDCAKIRNVAARSTGETSPGRCDANRQGQRGPAAWGALAGASRCATQSFWMR